jgi:predicted RNA-binding Zn-ribbon protein involved in translation (DUF1610 family)
VNCPFCSRRLERITVRGETTHCCPKCSVAWRSGLRNTPVSRVAAESATALICPGCGHEGLDRVRTTAEAEEWKCVTCHGRLLRLAAPPSPERMQTPSQGGDTPGTVVEVLADIAEFIFDMAT